MNRITLQPGYILHHRPYRNSSFLLEVFTPEHGRVGLVARGAATGRTKRGPLLSPFQAMLFSWTQRGELGTLIGSETSKHFLQLQGDALLAAMYLNELLLKLLPRHAPESEVYGLYDRTLNLLATQAPIEYSLRIFEKRLLGALGYGLSLDVDSQGRDLDAGQRYIYREEQGVIMVKSSPAGVVTYRGKSLLDLANEQLGDERSLQDAKYLLRHLLSAHVGQRGIKMRDLFNKKL